jgi:hypothetical protein
MLIKIDKPNSQMDWIVVETDAIVSIAPLVSTAKYCQVTLSNDRSFHLAIEFMEKFKPLLDTLSL